MAGHCCPAPATYPEVVTRRAGACFLAKASSLFGLAPCVVCPALRIAAQAVRSYRTFSPLPRLSLRRSDRRYVFCGTFRHPKRGLAQRTRSVRRKTAARDARTLSGTLLCGVRTFLFLTRFGRALPGVRDTTPGQCPGTRRGSEATARFDRQHLIIAPLQAGHSHPNRTKEGAMRVGHPATFSFTFRVVTGRESWKFKSTN